jgi:type I restriction enzyme S subunit
MSSDWLKLTLGELCAQQGGAIQTGPFGSQLHTSDYKAEGTPVVMPTNIVGSRVTEDGIARIDKADVERLSTHKLRIGDLVFSRRGDVTKNALVRAREVGWLCGTGCLKVRLGNESLASAEFVSYYLQLPDIKEWLIQHAVGATMPNLNTGILSEVPLTLAPPEIQKKIIHLLAALDASILTLQQQNTVLESIAQTLFRSWFVDFDPVHAKLAGNEPDAMSPELAALFPSEFENSELGLIPMGWAVTTFGNAFDIKGGGTPSTKDASYWDNGTHSWATPKDMSNLASKVIYQTAFKLTTEGVNKIGSKVLPVGTTLMSSRAPVGYLAIAKAPISINQGFIAIPPTEGLPSSFIVNLLVQKMPEIKANAGGTTFAEISKSQFRPIKWVLPSKEVMKAFGRIAEPLYASVHANCLTIDALIGLRDHLLPRLISGKLRIEDAEASVTELTSGLEAEPA